MQVPIDGEVVEWRGPAPYYFLPIRGDAAEEVVAVAADLTYGWGVVPVTATAGATRWTTSLTHARAATCSPSRTRFAPMRGSTWSTSSTWATSSTWS